MSISTDAHPELVGFNPANSKPLDTDEGWNGYLEATTTAIKDHAVFGVKFTGGVIGAWMILRALSSLQQAGVL